MLSCVVHYYTAFLRGKIKIHASVSVINASLNIPELRIRKQNIARRGRQVRKARQI
jgi:hypothetical protein